MARADFRSRAAGRRRPGTRRAHTRVLIVCGAEVTESEYFEYVAGALAATGVHTKIVREPASPVALVEAAVKLKELEVRQAKLHGDPSNMWNSVWAITDVDDFGGELQRATSAAVAGGVDLCISNPCFEIWLLWHVKACGSALSNKQVQELARSQGLMEGKKGKNIVISQIAGRYSVASMRSKEVRRQHSRDGKTSPRDIPASSVDVLVDSLIEAQKRRDPSFSVEL